MSRYSTVVIGNIARQRRAECIALARSYFGAESAVFVRLAWQWHRMVMRANAASRDAERNATEHAA